MKSMIELNLENLYEQMYSYKQQIQNLQDGIKAFSNILEENKDCEKKAKSIERLKGRLERELSITLFKCALVEDRINREEGRRKSLR